MTRGRKTLHEIFAIARVPSLTPIQKALWIVIRSYDSGKGAWPALETLAADVGVSERTVERERARLLKRGYLTRKLRGREPALWWAVLPQSQAQIPPVPNGKARYDVPWDYQDEAVRKLEQMAHLDAAGRVDELDDDYYDYYLAMGKQIWSDLVADEPWRRTEARAELHRKLPSIVEAVHNGNGQR